MVIAVCKSAPIRLLTAFSLHKITSPSALVEISDTTLPSLSAQNKTPGLTSTKRVVTVLFWVTGAIENNSVKECKRCSSDIPWCEMIEALDNGGLCGWCQHFKEKMDEE